MSKPTPDTERDELRNLLLQRIGIPANIYVNIDDKSNNLDTILQAFATQKKQLLEAVLKGVGENEWEKSEHDQLRNVRAKVRNNLREELRLHIKKLMEEV